MHHGQACLAVAVVAGHEQVAHQAAAAFLDLHAVTIRAAADQGDVGEARNRARQRVVVVGLACAFEAVVLAETGAVLDQAELDLAAPALVPVDRVVAAFGDDQVARVRGAAEELDAVVAAAIGLHVLDDRAVADRLCGDRVDFLVGLEHVARITDLDVAQDTRVVVRIVPAVHELLVELAAARGSGIALVVRRIAGQHDAAPILRLRIAAGDTVARAGEDDRCVRLAVRDQLGAWIDVQVIGGVAAAGHDRARFDGQGRAVGVEVADLDEAFEDPGGVVGQGHVAGDDAAQHATARRRAGRGAGRATRERGVVHAAGLGAGRGEELGGLQGLLDRLVAGVRVRVDADFEFMATVELEVDGAERYRNRILVAVEGRTGERDEIRSDCTGLELADTGCRDDPLGLTSGIEDGAEHVHDLVAARARDDVDDPAAVLPVARHPVAVERVPEDERRLGLCDHAERAGDEDSNQGFFQ